MDNRLEWINARNALRAALSSLGHPEELADLMAKQLGSPKAIGRMTAYLYQAKPHSIEEAVDEMLQKTNTVFAPWYVLESNDKKYARVKALQIVVDAVKKACQR